MRSFQPRPYTWKQWACDVCAAICGLVFTVAVFMVVAGVVLLAFVRWGL